MEMYDIIMLAIVLLSVLFGFWKGFAWQIATVAAFVVSYIVAARFHTPVADYFSINPFVAMFGLFILTSLGVWLGYGLIHRQIEKMQLKSFDRQIGAVVGLGSGVVICLVVTFFAVTIFGEAMGKKVVHSSSGKYIAQVIQKMDGILPSSLQSKVDPYLQKLDDELESAKKSPPSNDDDKSIAEIVSDSAKNGDLIKKLTDEEKFIQKIERSLRDQN